MAQSVHCPLCNHDVFIDEVVSLYNAEYDGVEENIFSKIYDIKYDVLQCPHCHKVFINEYVSYDGQNFSLDLTYPINQKQVSFDTRIEDISPIFVKTYNQAILAEAYHLNEITGIAFRKSFEILVKDYAIFLNPHENQKEILQKSLSQVISKYFNNSEFDPIFRKISWLGNDHSHTFNKHEKYNVNDLKRFINACVSKIISQLDLQELDTIEAKNN